MAKVKVIARLRPSLHGELSDSSIRVHDHQTTPEPPRSYVSIPSSSREGKETMEFEFSSCFEQLSTQTQVFDREVRPLIPQVYSGMTTTIIAYGVTSSGKTFTMQGTKEDPGIIPRIVQAVIQEKDTFHCQPTFSMSYIEIYKEDVFDLLVARGKATSTKLQLRENNGQVFVANLTSRKFTSYEEFQTIYDRAATKRSVGSTALNDTSSRSHAILTLEVEFADYSQDKTLTGRINLVDLAGSENNKLTGNDSTRMAESSAINKSLSVLGQVVRALNEGQTQIPYRDSKLTRILKDSLGGRAICLLICNVAPGAKLRQDTYNTLHFASQAKKVENKPVANTKVLVKRAGIDTGVAALASSNANARPSLVPVAQSRRLSHIEPTSSSAFQPLTAIAEDEDQNARLAEMIEQKVKEQLKAMQEETSRKVREQMEAIQAKADEEMQAMKRQLMKEQLERRREETPPPIKQELQTLPIGLLTPLLKKEYVEEDDIRRRLDELEKIVCRGRKDANLADLLSPSSGKKTARAYVMVARLHSERGELQLAVDAYRKASKLVPSNDKIKERIIEIEWCINNGKDFCSSSPKARQPKVKKVKRLKGGRNSASSHASSPPTCSAAAGTGPKRSTKRPRVMDEDLVEAPPKKAKKSTKLSRSIPSIIDTSSDDEVEKMALYAD